MTYDDFTRELGAAGITGRDLARLLKLNVTTVANYKKRGDVPSHLAVIAALMHLLADHKIPFRERLEALDIAPNARRGRSFADRQSSSST